MFAFILSCLTGTNGRSSTHRSAPFSGVVGRLVIGASAADNSSWDSRPSLCSLADHLDDSTQPAPSVVTDNSQQEQTENWNNLKGVPRRGVPLADRFQTQRRRALIRIQDVYKQVGYISNCLISTVDDRKSPERARTHRCT